MKMEEMAGWDI